MIRHTVHITFSILAAAAVQLVSDLVTSFIETVLKQSTTTIKLFSIQFLFCCFTLAGSTDGENNKEAKICATQFLHALSI